MATLPEGAGSWSSRPERPNPVRVALAVAFLAVVWWTTSNPPVLTWWLPATRPAGVERLMAPTAVAAASASAGAPAATLAPSPCTGPAGPAADVRAEASADAGAACELDLPAGGTGTLDLARLAASDAADAETWRVTSPPQHGVATLAGSVLAYRPVGDYVGADRVRLEGTRPDGPSSAAEVGVLVLPRPAALQLSLESPAAIGPGQTISLAWTGSWPAADAQLDVVAREPGTVDAGTGAYDLRPGVRPADGAVHYLRPDRVWSDAAIPFQTGFGPGHLTVALPSDREGEWRIEVRLVDPSTGVIDAAAGQVVLVASQPAMLLRLDRPIVGSGEEVRAGALLAGAGPDSNLRVEASLVRPDGRVVPLPADGTAAHASSGSTVPLLAAAFGPPDRGAYRLRARLVDVDRGIVLGVADAGFAVCDTPRQVEGALQDVGGAPLAGGASPLDVVQAFDLDRGAITAVTTPDAAGRYRLVLAPGRYRLLGRVVDRAGWHEASSVDAVTVDCSGPPPTADLIAGPPRPLSPATSGWLTASDALPAGGAPAPSAAAGGPPCTSDTPAAVAVEARIDGANATPADERDLAEVFGTDLAGAAPGVAIVTPSSRALATTFALLGPPESAAAPPAPPDGPLDAPARALVWSAPGASGTVLTAVLVDAQSGRVIGRGVARLTGKDAVASLDALSALATSLARPNGRPLGCWLGQPGAAPAPVLPEPASAVASPVPTPVPVELDLEADATSAPGTPPTVADGHAALVVARARVAGAPLPWVPVTFALQGGMLTGGNTETDRLGDAAIEYAAPVSGQGTSQLTVEAVVGDERIDRTLTIRYREGAPCPIPSGAAYTAFCVTDLGPVAGSTPTDAGGASGEAVGGSGLDSETTVRPLGRSDFLGWSVAPDSGVRLDQGYDTGQGGTIYAYGALDGRPHAFLLTPR